MPGFKKHFDVIVAALVLSILAPILLLVWLLIMDHFDPMLHMKKSNWECTKWMPQSSLVVTIDHRALTPIPTQTSICVEYRRIGEN